MMQMKSEDMWLHISNASHCSRETIQRDNKQSYCPRIGVQEATIAVYSSELYTVSER